MKTRKDLVYRIEEERHEGGELTFKPQYSTNPPRPNSWHDLEWQQTTFHTLDAAIDHIEDFIESEPYVKYHEYCGNPK